MKSIGAQKCSSLKLVAIELQKSFITHFGSFCSKSLQIVKFIHHYSIIVTISDKQLSFSIIAFYKWGLGIAYVLIISTQTSTSVNVTTKFPKIIPFLENKRPVNKGSSLKQWDHFFIKKTLMDWLLTLFFYFVFIYTFCYCSFKHTIIILETILMVFLLNGIMSRNFCYQMNWSILPIMFLPYYSSCIKQQHFLQLWQQLSSHFNHTDLYTKFITKTLIDFAVHFLSHFQFYSNKSLS